MASLRTAVPRASFQFHARQLQQLRVLPALRYASTTPPPKPRVLEQPDKFRPPSHPSRLRTRSPRYVGPALSEAELRSQSTKQYPHMMPPEGSLMYRFLTSRTIHLWITLSILTSLVVGIWLADFLHTTPYSDLLPDNSMFLAHPIAFVRRWAEVYEMHVAYVSAQTAERRKQKVDDVKKRSDYRKAHGLDGADGGMFGGWTAKTDEEARGPAFRQRESEVSQPKSSSIMAVVQGNMEGGAEAAHGESGEAFVDFDGQKQPVRKKWLGIW